MVDKPKTKKTAKKATPKKVATKRTTKKAVSSKNSKETRNKAGNKRGLSEKSKSNLIPGANKKGRPKGKLNYDTMVDLAIEALAHDMVKQHNDLPKNKNKQITFEDIDIEMDIFKQHVLNARKGDQKALDSFMDRRHGKATARIELTGKDGDPIEIQQRKAEKKAAARKMLDMWTKGKKTEVKETK